MGGVRSIGAQAFAPSFDVGRLHSTSRRSVVRGSWLAPCVITRCDLPILRTLIAGHGEIRDPATFVRIPFAPSPVQAIVPARPHQSSSRSRPRACDAVGPWLDAPTYAYWRGVVGISAARPIPALTTTDCGACVVDFMPGTAAHSGSVEGVS